MKSLILISPLFLIIFSSARNNYVQNTLWVNPERISSAVCPSSKEFNKSGLEEFLTNPEWSSERVETDTEKLSASQITLLTDPKYSSVCAKLNDLNQEALNEKNSQGKPAFDLTYYKAGDFYFVIISRRPSNENSVIVGVSYLEVYNQNLEPIQGYGF